MSALAAIHTGLRQLGIADDDKRDFYQRLTGKRSLTEMSQRDQDVVLGELRRLGFKPSSKGAAKRIEGPYAKKLQALWIAMWNLGLTRDRSDAALITFVRRQTRIDHTRFLRHPGDAAKVIEALKGWMAREAGVEWTGDDLAPDWTRLPGPIIALAQWRLLRDFGVTMGPNTFGAFAEERAGRPIDQLTAGDWAAVMNTLGDRVRSASSKGQK